MNKRGAKRKPDNEVSKIALYYRQRREAQKNGTYKPKINYTPAMDNSIFEKYNIRLEPADNIFGWTAYYKEKPRTIQIGPNGYAFISVYDKEKYELNKEKNNRTGMITLLLHRLIYVKYIGPIREGETVDHINGNKLDNRIENLQILTREDNTRKRFKNII